VGRAAAHRYSHDLVVQFPLSDAILMTLLSPSGFLRCGLICALIVILPSCALWKPPSHSQIVTSALPEGTTIPPQWTAGGNRKEVGDNWLRSFHDPGLDAVVAEAIANNLDLRKAAAQVEIARQNVVVVASKMKPQVGVDLSYSGLRDDVQGHDHWYESKAGLAGVAWEADVWGKLRAQRAVAEAGYEATALDYAFARQSLAATTAKSWYLTVETSQLVALTEQSVRIYADLLTLVKTKRDLGKVSDLDVVEASANLNVAQSSLRQAQASASEARRELEVLVGRYPAAEVKVARNFAVIPPPIRAGLPSLLLERRPDIVAAERLVLAAFRAEEAAKLALLPSFSLTLDGGKLSDRLLSVLQINPWIVHAVVGMSVPIYTGGALQAQIKIASAQQQRAVAGYGSVVLTAFREVENGLTNESLLAQRLQFEKKALSDRTEAVRISRLQYEAGEIDLLSVLQLQNDQITTQGNLISLKNSQLANRINLHLALGGGFDRAPAASAGE
jgi:multidrug efflux system outer membrane protein